MGGRGAALVYNLWAECATYSADQLCYRNAIGQKHITIQAPLDLKKTMAFQSELDFSFSV